MFYYDSTYWTILVPAMLIALFAQIKVSSTFRRYSQMATSIGHTGAQTAAAVLVANGIAGVHIEPVAGSLTDHYDPRLNAIRLSDSVYNSSNVAAIGVATHEAGHAIQYAVAYGPICLRNAIIPVCDFGSRIFLVLIVLAFFIYSPPLLGLGIVLFAVTVFGLLITLPVEFNASRRAIDTLKQGHMLGDKALACAKKVLCAVAMTYVAALLISLAHLFRYIVAFSQRRRS